MEFYHHSVGRMNETQTKIINSYKKISGFVFHHLIFLIALVIALGIFQRVITQSTTINIFQTNNTLIMQKTKLIAEFGKFLRQNVKDNDLQIQVLQWDFQTEAWFIKSVNNLITYKWFVIPRYFYMYNTIPVKQLSYFSGADYDINELENFVDTFVFTKKITVTQSFNRTQIPLLKTLNDEFNLSCVFENKISKNACNYYLNDFLDSFFIYDISTDYSGLQKIFGAVKDNTAVKWRFCEGLSKYLLYANDQSDIIKEIFGLCWSTYESLFKRTVFFMEIQNTLENQSFEKTSYKDILLNEYKLLSYQQQIYQDFLINKVDVYKITGYLDFIKEVLAKNAVESFYKDETYWYNNKYLVPSLEKIVYQSNIFSQNLWGSRISSLLTTINALNDWEPMLGLVGLTSAIQNKGLVVQKGIDTWADTAAISVTEKIQKKLQNISYLTIEKQTVSDTAIDIIGYLKFFSPDGNETIKSHIIMIYENDMLLVKSIELQNKAGINDVIKNLLLIQNFSIGELYSYISKNLVFYEQTNAPISASTELCPGLQTIKKITIIACANTWVIIDKNSLRYQFSLKNGGIDNVTLSDKTLENLIKTSYNAIVGNTYTLIDTIQAILNYEAVQGHVGTTNAIVVFEKIQQYLGIKANDIADNSGAIFADISLWGIDFIVKYTIETNMLGPRYFKDILANGKPYLIQNLNLFLDDTHQNSINNFVIDPLTAIQNADLTARQNYNERLKKNN